MEQFISDNMDGNNLKDGIQPYVPYFPLSKLDVSKWWEFESKLNSKSGNSAASLVLNLGWVNYSNELSPDDLTAIETLMSTLFSSDGWDYIK